jgi:hypothetical protein
MVVTPHYSQHACVCLDLGDGSVTASSSSAGAPAWVLRDL